MPVTTVGMRASATRRPTCRVHANHDHGLIVGPCAVRTNGGSCGIGTDEASISSSVSIPLAAALRQEGVKGRLLDERSSP